MNQHDRVNFTFIDRKPRNGELYLCDNKQICLCNDRDFNEKNGWPANDIKTIVPILTYNTLNLQQTTKLSQFIFENKIPNGSEIYLTINFKIS